MPTLGAVQARVLVFEPSILHDRCDTQDFALIFKRRGRFSPRACLFRVALPNRGFARVRGREMEQHDSLPAKKKKRSSKSEERGGEGEKERMGGTDISISRWIIG
jgi:hypothetical protein